MLWVLIDTGTHCGGIVNRQFVSMLSLGVSHGLMGTHCGCIANRLFVSMMSRVLIRSVLTIFYLSP